MSDAFADFTPHHLHAERYRARYPDYPVGLADVVLNVTGRGSAATASIHPFHLAGQTSVGWKFLTVPITSPEGGGGWFHWAEMPDWLAEQIRPVYEPLWDITEGRHVAPSAG